MIKYKSYSQVGWGSSPFCMDATWRPLLQRTGSDAFFKMLSQSFKTFAAPLHNVSKFPLSQRKPKNVSAFFPTVQHTLLTWATLTGLQLCQIRWNKQGPLFDCKLKKELSTSAKSVWVGATVCVCQRFLAIDDLSGETMKLRIYQGLHAVPSLGSQSSSSVFPTVNLFC